MRVVIDALPVGFGGFAVALESMLSGWEQLEADDELHLALAEGVELEVPDFVHLHRMPLSWPQGLSRLSQQSLGIRSLCRQVGADVLLGWLPTVGVLPVGCPKVIKVYDMRHELLPTQFSFARRTMRRLSYGVGYRQASSIICISERTQTDLLRLHPRLKRKPVVVVLWGADHTDRWPRPGSASADEAYALAFGHFPNKAVNRVIDAWKMLADEGRARPLVFVGLPRDARDDVNNRIAAAGLSDLIIPLPWLSDEEFRQKFAGAGMIVFPSDFEGFGLPAVEALRLGIPLVISPDSALQEVTGGHAETMEGWNAEALARAVDRAWARTPYQCRAAQDWAAGFTWKRMARGMRQVLVDTIASQR